MFEVVLDAYQGPLDLLLHLIRKHELSIFDIPIHFITERFLEALAEMEELDLTVGGEFLVMAATLAQIKSRMLLPRSTDEAEDEDEDPRHDLVRQLVEYQRYRNLAQQLDERAQLGHEVFARPESTSQASGPPPPQRGPLDLLQLIEAYHQVKRRAGFRRDYAVIAARRSVKEEMVRAARTLDLADRVPFWELVERHADGEVDIISLVGVFLGVLEMARLGLIRVYQTGPDAADLAVEAAVNGLEEAVRKVSGLV